MHILCSYSYICSLYYNSSGWFFWTSFHLNKMFCSLEIVCCFQSVHIIHSFHLNEHYTSVAFTQHMAIDTKLFSFLTLQLLPDLTLHANFNNLTHTTSKLHTQFTSSAFSAHTWTAFSASTSAEVLTTFTTYKLTNLLFKWQLNYFHHLQAGWHFNSFQYSHLEWHLKPFQISGLHLCTTSALLTHTIPSVQRQFTSTAFTAYASADPLTDIVYQFIYSNWH